MSGFISARGGRLTLRRLVIVLAVCVAICAIVAMFAPLFGIVTGRGGRSIEILGRDVLEAGTPAYKIFAVRLPRVVASLLIGGALAGAGCALQALLRNPLAEPFTLGIASGSSLAAVLAIRLGIEASFGGLGVGTAAFAGAIGTMILVAQLARIGRQLPPATLILAGVTISMFCSSVSVLVQYTSDFTDVSHMLSWMMGGLDAVRLGTAEWAALPIVGGLFVLWTYGRELNALAAGPEVAASLGVSVVRTQAIVFAIASLLVGAAILLGGPIGFIGLVVPHVLRSIVGPDHRVLLPASIFGGAVLLTLCDTLARTVIAPAHLPTGAVTAVMGGPFFIAILIRQKRRAALWGRG
ncbi:MAG: transport system permease protein [Myxococcales bacterium]|nr:transport system permease protein [Myxococcales bacterium]